MMKLIGRTLMAAAVVASFASVSFAETNWNGGYAGLDFGYGWGATSTAFEDGNGGNGGGYFGPASGGLSGNGAPGAFTQSLHRSVYGVHGGYNWLAWRGLTVGWEASYLGAAVLGNSQDNFVAMGNTDKVSYETRIYSLISAAPKIGWAWDRWLFGAKGGFAFGHVTARGDNATRKTTYSQEQIHNGWTVGLSADYAVSEHWLAGLGYDYYSLADKTYGTHVTPDTTWPITYHIRPVLRTLSAKVAYKF